MFNVKPGLERDRHHVAAGLGFGHSGAAAVFAGDAPEGAEFIGADGAIGRTEGVGFAGFDFNDHDFVAVVQVLIYVGGILILILFAVMLTHRIADVRISNRSVGRLPSLAICVVVGAMMLTAVMRGGWHQAEVIPATPTTAQIGELFLSHYLLPFELASVVLLAALIGAAFLSRKELKDL